MLLRWGEVGEIDVGLMARSGHGRDSCGFLCRLYMDAVCQLTVGFGPWMSGHPYHSTHALLSPADP